MHTCIRAYMHTYIHVHTYIHTYVTGFTKTVPIGTKNEIQIIADY